jgi:5-formyltetrahydrofolate cyclo-ligase
MERAVMEETRNRLRSAALARRSSLPPETCLSSSRSIQAKAIELPFYLAARSVALYCAVGNEVDTRPLIDHALCHGKKVFCPRSARGDSAFFVRLNSEADLCVGRSGVPEPTGDAWMSAADIENLVVMVPGVLFDLQGNRLGRGGGWYDRALQWLGEKGLFVGLAYEWQVVVQLPAEVWDQRVHYLITESRVIDCRVPSSARITRSTERGCC